MKTRLATLIENQMLASPARVLPMASATISAGLDHAADPVDPAPRLRALEKQRFTYSDLAFLPIRPGAWLDQVPDLLAARRPAASTPPGGPRREVSMPLSPTPISFSASRSVKK